MSRRFGWLIVSQNLKPQVDQLLRKFRHNRIPTRTRKEKAADYVMRKVDDDLELSLGFGEEFTLVQGQFDFGLSSFDAIDEICRSCSIGTLAMWISVEGTSGGHLFKKFRDGVLVQSYAESEGELEFDLCVGQRPVKNADGGIGEWQLGRVCKMGGTDP